MNMLFVYLQLQILATPVLAKCVLQNIKKIFALTLLMIACYIIFVICDIGPSCLAHIVVILIKNFDTTKAKIKEINMTPRNFLKGYKYPSNL
jgi:hypothetical protein